MFKITPMGNLTEKLGPTFRMPFFKMDGIDVVAERIFLIASNEDVIALHKKGWTLSGPSYNSLKGKK